MKVKVAGINTVEAILSNIKGDMSNVLNVVVPTFEDVYEALGSLNDEKENAPSEQEINGYENAINSIFAA